jgi:uncharacterized protein involved in exopolysaccharide biosynthesis
MARFAALPAVRPGELDLRVIGRTLWRRKRLIIVPTVLAAILSMVAVNLITPRYKSEARILIDGRENIFLRPNADRAEMRTALDAEAVTSQVQLVLSRDLARDVIQKNKLAERPEFDSVLRGISPLKSVLALFGIGRDPLRLAPEERVLDAYYDRLAAFAMDKSRVIAVEFQSQDPELASRVANSIAEEYLVMQQSARQTQARSAGQWLSGEIDNLRKKVTDAEARVEEFRSKSSLFVGTNNTTLSNQQLGEINSQLTNARAQKSDAESRAHLIREMLQNGRSLETSEVLNSELVRRLIEQKVTLQAQLAEQSSTLLDGHPRIKELKAQLADLDRQVRDEANKIARSLENDARISGARVESLTASLDQMKRQATSNNGQDVELRAMEREAKSQRDLLESYLAKYREATARETIDSVPTDERIISKAAVTNTPAFPKKLPIVLIATLATLMLSGGLIASSELLRITAPGAQVETEEPNEPIFSPVNEWKNLSSAMSSDPLGPFTELEQLANLLNADDERSCKITIVGVEHDESSALISLVLARLLARRGKVVLVTLSTSVQASQFSSDGSAVLGLSDLMLGLATFGQVIGRDRLSLVHVVGVGRNSGDRSLLQSPRLSLAIDALSRAYDYVLLDAGTAADLPASLLASDAYAVVIPDPAMDGAARALMCEQLLATGFVGVTMLSGPVESSSADASPTTVAAA